MLDNYLGGKYMANVPERKKNSIKEAVVDLETVRNSTIIYYIGAHRAFHLKIWLCLITTQTV